MKRKKYFYPFDEVLKRAVNWFIDLSMNIFFHFESEIVMLPIDTYRIKTDRFKRTWQAEWEGCFYACRAYTKRGVIRKAKRWQKWGTDFKRYKKARDEEAKNGGRIKTTSRRSC